MDVDIRPRGLEKLFLRDQLPFPAGKGKKNVHCPTTEVNLLAPAEQFAMSPVESEWTKVHDLVWFCRHDVSKPLFAMNDKLTEIKANRFRLMDRFRAGCRSWLDTRERRSSMRPV
jgi:hypothetical protein